MSWFQLSTPCFPFGPSAPWPCLHNGHRVLSFLLHSYHSVHTATPATIPPYTYPVHNSDDICDKCYYYNKIKFNNINEFDIKAFFLSFLFFLFHLSHLSRYNNIYDKICVKIYTKIDKAYNNIYNKCYYYNKEKLNNINKFNIKNIIKIF